MREEDRTSALEMYGEIFDEIGNDTAVLQMLVSPTRQAVNLARAYDGKSRAYEIETGQVPAFQLVIEDLRRDALMLIPAEPKAEEDQISLFSDSAPAENVFDSLGFGILTDTPEQGEAPGKHPHGFGMFPDEDTEDEPAPLSPPPAVPVVPEVPEPRTQEVDDFADAVDAFLADFTLEDDLTPAQETVQEQLPISPIQDEDSFTETVQTPAVKGDVPAAEEPHLADVSTLSMPQAEPHTVRAHTQYQERYTPAVSVQDVPDMTGTTERKANVALLILFILIAVPVGLLCAGVILAAALLVLGFAVTAVCAGVSGLISAFGFSVFADILLVFGLALALAAIGLLLLWVFIWLLGGVIPGLVRGICALARRLCYKEVSA